MSHVHEKIDFTADVFIVYKDKVLLRMHDKYKMWLSVGGHVELDEDPNEAAVREVKEEVGLDVKLWAGHMNPIPPDGRIKILIPPVHMNRHSTSTTHEHISLVYFATSDTDNVRPAEGEQQDGWKWFTREEVLKGDIPQNIKDYAVRALDTLSEN
jgi:ADP-ribose pyrophosphatase YjhB (NUDIX family)